MKAINKLLFLVVMIIFSMNANANQLNSSGLLDNLLDKYQQVASTWTTVLSDYANWLFWGLVLISMAWNFWHDRYERGRGSGFTRRSCKVLRYQWFLLFYFKKWSGHIKIHN